MTDIVAVSQNKNTLYNFVTFIYSLPMTATIYCIGDFGVIGHDKILNKICLILFHVQRVKIKINKQLCISIKSFTKRVQDRRTREQGVTISDSMPVRAL